MEVVVNVHAAQTTISEQSQLGIMTCSKRKLITSETETATNSLRLHVQLQLSKQPQHGRRRHKGARRLLLLRFLFPQPAELSLGPFYAAMFLQVFLSLFS
jgi:hypothetical protein